MNSCNPTLAQHHKCTRAIIFRTGEAMLRHKNSESGKIATNRSPRQNTASQRRQCSHWPCCPGRSLQRNRLSRNRNQTDPFRRAARPASCLMKIAEIQLPSCVVLRSTNRFPLCGARRRYVGEVTQPVETLSKMRWLRRRLPSTGSSTDL
jgi:hypothetical protein